MHERSVHAVRIFQGGEDCGVPVVAIRAVGLLVALGAVGLSRYSLKSVTRHETGLMGEVVIGYHIVQIQSVVAHVALAEGDFLFVTDSAFGVGGQQCGAAGGAGGRGCGTVTGGTVFHGFRLSAVVGLMGKQQRGRFRFLPAIRFFRIAVTGFTLRVVFHIMTLPALIHAHGSQFLFGIVLYIFMAVTAIEALLRMEIVRKGDNILRCAARTGSDECGEEDDIEFCLF